MATKAAERNSAAVAEAPARSKAVLRLEEADVHIIGLVPLMTHNGQLANPLNEIAKKIKSITSKRKKTDDDFIEIAHLEFLGGLYLGDDGKPCIPGTVIEGCLKAGAKKQRLGPAFDAGLSCYSNWPLIYDGPKDPEKLWNDKRFVDVRGVSVNGNTVQRCRAIFHNWELKFRLTFDNSLIDAGQVEETLGIAGMYCGLCDYTPKFGRFSVESFELV